MTPRDVELVRARLTSIVAAATRLAAQAEDLYWVGHEQRVTDRACVDGGETTGPEAIGDQRARSLWRKLAGGLPTLEVALVTLDQLAGNLLSEGPSAPDTWGSEVSLGDFSRRLRNQDKNRRAGEYVPHRTEAQPKHPRAR